MSTYATNLVKGPKVLMNFSPSEETIIQKYVAHYESLHARLKKLEGMLGIEVIDDFTAVDLEADIREGNLDLNGFDYFLLKLERNVVRLEWKYAWWEQIIVKVRSGFVKTWKALTRLKH